MCSRGYILCTICKSWMNWDKLKYATFYWTEKGCNSLLWKISSKARVAFWFNIWLQRRNRWSHSFRIHPWYRKSKSWTNLVNKIIFHWMALSELDLDMDLNWKLVNGLSAWILSHAIFCSETWKVYVEHTRKQYPTVWK